MAPLFHLLSTHIHIQTHSSLSPRRCSHAHRHTPPCLSPHTRTDVLDHDALGVVDLAPQLLQVVGARVRVVEALLLYRRVKRGRSGGAGRFSLHTCKHTHARSAPCLHASKHTTQTAMPHISRATLAHHRGLQRRGKAFIHGEGDGGPALLLRVSGGEAPLHVFEEEEGQPPLIVGACVCMC